MGPSKMLPPQAETPFPAPHQGRDEAVAALFCRYREKLRRMIRARLDPRITAKVDTDDILQDVFVAVARRIGDYWKEPSVPVFVWIRRMASQVLVDTHRRYLAAKRRDARREIPLALLAAGSASSISLASLLADSLTTPSQAAMRGESVAQLQEALEELDSIDREVLVLRHLEELTNGEVAELLGIGNCAASKRYLRALARLRAAMAVGGDRPGRGEGPTPRTCGMGDQTP